MDPSGQARTLRLPFDVYKPSASHVELVRQAVDMLTNRCVRARGHDRPTTPPVNVIDAPNRRRYGVIELQVARTVGYHPPRTSDQEKLREAARALGGRRSPSAMAATRACLDQSYDRVYAKGTESALLVRLERESFEGTQRNDPKVRAAFADWSACMRQHGQKAYTDPLAAISDDRWDSPLPGKAEIATAVADVECKQKVGLVAVWHEAETKFQTKAVKEHRTQLAQVQQALQRERATAQNIIASA